MIKVYKLTNPRLGKFEYYFYSKSSVEAYQKCRIGKPVTDDIIEEVDLDETKFLIDRFNNIREAKECQFYLHNDDEELVDAYDGTLFLGSFEPDEFLAFGLTIDNMTQDEFDEWKTREE